jgi:hypothetical protein
MDIDRAAIEVLKAPDHYWGAQTELVEQGWGGTFGIHRDSDLLEKSNYETILKLFNEKYEQNEDWRIESASHFLVGWMDTLMVRVLKCKCEELGDSTMPLILRHPDWESKGNKTWLCHTCNSPAFYTDIFVESLEILSKLEEYPVLDEEDYARREHEDMMEYLEQEVGEEHAPALFTYLFDTYSVSNSDDVRYEWIEEWKELNIPQEDE